MGLVSYYRRRVTASFQNQWLFTSGYAKPTCQVTLKDKDQLLFGYITIYSILKKGIVDTLEMNGLITMYRDSIWGLHASSSSFDVTPDYLVYSDNGRTKKCILMVRVYSWSDWMQRLAPDIIIVVACHVFGQLLRRRRIQQVFRTNDFDLFTSGYAKPTCQVTLKETKTNLSKMLGLHNALFPIQFALE